MTDRHTVNTITSNALDRLYDELAALRTVARGYCPACGRGDAAPTVTHWEQQRDRADEAEHRLAHLQESSEAAGRFLTRTVDERNQLQATVDRAREGAAWIRHNYPALTHANDRLATALDQPAPGPAATEEAKTTRVFAALHRAAEQDVSRVIALYEQWVKAGPPPIGTPMVRWWDARLAELHNTILGQPAQDASPTGTVAREEHPPLG